MLVSKKELTNLKLRRKYQPAMRRNAKKRPAAKPPPLALGWLLTVNRQIR
jgi:hypothetical protein